MFIPYRQLNNINIFYMTLNKVYLGSVASMLALPCVTLGLSVVYTSASVSK